MIKMRRTENASWIRPEEVFHDGVLYLTGDNKDIAVIPDGKEHWELQLLLRGYENITEDAPATAEEETPQPVVRGKRKVAKDRAPKEM